MFKHCVLVYCVLESKLVYCVHGSNRGKIKNTEQFCGFCAGNAITLKILCLVTRFGTLLNSNNLRCVRQPIAAVGEDIVPARTMGWLPCKVDHLLVIPTHPPFNQKQFNLTVKKRIFILEEFGVARRRWSKCLKKFTVFEPVNHFTVFGRAKAQILEKRPAVLLFLLGQNRFVKDHLLGGRDNL